ncbi:MAG: FtsB family cell division protein [Nocardioides sp.]
MLAVLMVSYASSMRAYLQQKQHIDALSVDIAHSQVAIAKLEREKKRWGDPAYVRAMAHQRFGWVLPGEIGFQVIGEDGTPLDHQDSLSDPGPVTESARPIWWKTAWGSMEAAGNPPDPADAPVPATRIRAPKTPTKQ